MGGGDLHIRYVSTVGAHGRWVSWWSLVFRTSRKGTLNTKIMFLIDLKQVQYPHLSPFPNPPPPCPTENVLMFSCKVLKPMNIPFLPSLGKCGIQR